MIMLEAEERAALRDALERLLADHCAQDDVRRTMATASGYDDALWRQLAQMGIVGLLIDPQYGGSGAGPLEIGEVMEAAGAALLGSPLLSSAVLAATLLDACDDLDAQARLLPGIADGSRIATVAMTGERGSWTPEGIAVTATTSDSAATLSGTASYVTYGQAADTLLVVARLDTGFGVFEVDPAAQGVTITPLETFDRTQRLARIEFDQAPASRVGTAGWEAVEQMLAMGLVALAGQQAGGAERLFNMTVDYIRERYQFGRAVGGFQAIKHMAADLLLEKESAISAARHAAHSLAHGAGDADAAVSLAAFYCADAYSKIAADSIQMHGGIGFTWEYPAHLYVRRARADAQMLGSPAWHRERYLTQMGG
jgi:alkylation response protein AidB-like acyl-CoA dehydrogenase